MKVLEEPALLMRKRTHSNLCSICFQNNLFCRKKICDNKISATGKLS